MQAACWYVLLLLQPTVYLVSRDRSGIFEIDTSLTWSLNNWGEGGGCGGRGRQFSESCVFQECGTTLASFCLDS